MNKISIKNLFVLFLMMTLGAIIGSIATLNFVNDVLSPLNINITLW